MHANETFAVTWDPHRLDWQTGRDYVEQFLKDVADGSGSLSSQYAAHRPVPRLPVVAPATPPSTAAAASTSVSPAAPPASLRARSRQVPVTTTSAATARSAVRTTSGRTRAARGDRTPTRTASPTTRSGPRCRRWWRDGAARTHAAGLHAADRAADAAGRRHCLDVAGKVCSANGVSTAQFCSYHAQASVGGTTVSYVVQPWTG